ncbi:uncharacterized protein SAPINGB_P001886 [Magnusiomyces paraingens]|uniref:Purple acid phosphatase n=1 Tax=Magnusiomyces paraingens TaxID=2606893 RepID=A0A5E8BGQ8_9ASCO|nr:uncharacterized protein SAPINGB_P001886 [Saprochaete ingens]VVT48656.1 unnamed protein product [Saprochaete ingens]
MANQSKLVRASVFAIAALLAVCAIPAAATPMPDALPIPENKLAPVQHRIAFAGEDGISVSWNTFAQLGEPQVFYGTSPDQLSQVASSQISQTYLTSTTYSNHVKLSGLEPNTTYYYQVSNSPDGFPVYSFTTPPLSKTNSFEPFKFAVAVDLGTMGPLGLSETTGKGDGGVLLPGERNTIKALADNKDEFEFMWHPGDIAYADYWLKEELHGYLAKNISTGYQVYESILNQFYDDISSIASYKPYMVGPGNHEANCDNGGTKDKANNISYTVSLCMPGQTNFTGYQSHWRMPSEESGGNTNMWYSYNWGPVHFVQIDTETDLGNGITGPDEGSNMRGGPFGSYTNEQFDWLNKDLASVDRCKTPWVIVAGHRPWYTVDSSSVCSTCQSAFEETLIKYNVDVAVFGHVHNYQRWDPIKNNEVDPNGLNNPSSPWYFVNGAAGHYDGMDSLNNDNSPAGFKFGFDNTYGWSRFTVHNETHITHEFVASRNDSVMDTATLFKKHDLSSCAVPDTSSSVLPSTSSATSSNVASSSATSTFATTTGSAATTSSVSTSSGATTGSASSRVATTSGYVSNTTVISTAISSSGATSSAAATTLASTIKPSSGATTAKSSEGASSVKSSEAGSTVVSGTLTSILTSTETVSCHSCKGSSASSGDSTAVVTDLVTGTLTDVVTSISTIPCPSCKASGSAAGSGSVSGHATIVSGSEVIDTVTASCSTSTGSSEVSTGTKTATVSGSGHVTTISGSEVIDTVTASCSTSTGAPGASAGTETVTVSCHTCKENSTSSAGSVAHSSSGVATGPAGTETVTVSCHTCTASGSSAGSALHTSSGVSSVQSVKPSGTASNSIEIQTETKILTVSIGSTVSFSSSAQPSASAGPHTTSPATNITTGAHPSTLSTFNHTSSISIPVQVAPSATLEQTNDAASKTTMLHSSIMGAIAIALFYLAF